MTIYIEHPETGELVNVDELLPPILWKAQAVTIVWEPQSLTTSDPPPTITPSPTRTGDCQQRATPRP